MSSTMSKPIPTDRKREVIAEIKECIAKARKQCHETKTEIKNASPLEPARVELFTTLGEVELRLAELKRDLADARALVVEKPPKKAATKKVTKKLADAECQARGSEIDSALGVETAVVAKVATSECQTEEQAAWAVATQKSVVHTAERRKQGPKRAKPAKEMTEESEQSEDEEQQSVCLEAEHARVVAELVSLRMSELNAMAAMPRLQTCALEPVEELEHARVTAEFASLRIFAMTSTPSLQTRAFETVEELEAQANEQTEECFGGVFSAIATAIEARERCFANCKEKVEEPEEQSEEAKQPEEVKQPVEQVEQLDPAMQAIADIKAGKTPRFIPKMCYCKFLGPKNCLPGIKEHSCCCVTVEPKDCRAKSCHICMCVVDKKTCRANEYAHECLCELGAEKCTKSYKHKCLCKVKKPCRAT